jgi:hypothetical protein
VDEVRILAILRKIVGAVLVLLSSLFLLVSLFAFVVGAIPAGLFGLTLSAGMLWTGLWCLQRPSVIRLHSRIFTGGPYLRGRDLRIPYLVGAIPFVILCLLFLVLGSIAGAVFSIVFVFLFPLGTWRLLTNRLARFVFLKVVRSERLRHFLTVLSRKEEQVPTYFFASVTRRPIIWRRFLRVAIFSLALSAAVISYTNIGPQTQITATGEVALLGIIVLALPSLVYAVLWVYEDSGLRYYDSTGAMVSVPISRSVDLVTGLVGIGTFIRFVQLISANAIQASANAFALLFFLLSPILLAVTIFHHKMEPQMITNLRESGVAPIAQITIVP